MTDRHQIERRIAGHVAAIELRSLLVSDAPLAASLRDRLVRSVARLNDDPQVSRWLEQRLTMLIQRRFGRNPDNFQVSGATRKALLLLGAAQRGHISVRQHRRPR
ncbi:MAG: hypothetical protein K5872_01340 [Rhizobiaceae bacterium]|nr:hypothetical protein [Rhizobiaceae bacterium]MCV0404854.1 hypothetical protein [Rhizobiaceae bacterium]